MNYTGLYVHYGPVLASGTASPSDDCIVAGEIRSALKPISQSGSVLPGNRVRIEIKLRRLLYVLNWSGEQTEFWGSFANRIRGDDAERVIGHRFGSRDADSAENETYGDPK